MQAVNFFKMIVFHHQNDLKDHLLSYRSSNKSIGFVPTMGALHKGHLSLMKKALQENDILVVSIFVNPTQFNNVDDLEKYPRDLDSDRNTIASLQGEIVVYAPAPEDVYEDKVISEVFSFDGLENQMEGRFRPGHFDGVGTIVKKLLQIVSPNKAYFGEKDYQQLLIVKKMVAIEQLPVVIVGCPILREENGLAMSSRNERLSLKVRQKSGFIYKTLLDVQACFTSKSFKEISTYVEKMFEQQEDFKLEYFSITDADTLEAVESAEDNKKYRAFIAVYADGDVRHLLIILH